MAFFFGLLYNDYMNTQITQLAKQAGATTRSVCHGHGDYRTEFQLSDDSIQKFAELIVKECGQYLNSPEFIGRSDLDWSMVLNEHFGVE